jgi:hypothetical protein
MIAFDAFGDDNPTGQCLNWINRVGSAQVGSMSASQVISEISSVLIALA